VSSNLQPLPPEERCAIELALYIKSRRGIVDPSWAYAGVAGILDVAPELRTRLMPDGKHVHWENRLQWARNSLVKHSIIDPSIKRRWALVKGIDVEQTLEAAFPLHWQLRLLEPQLGCRLFLSGGRFPGLQTAA
jgi:hypothetical protein